LKRFDVKPCAMSWTIIYGKNGDDVHTSQRCLGKFQLLTPLLKEDDKSRDILRN